jgi:excisionase family DNA binding protein
MLEEHLEPEWVSYPEAERFSGLSHTSLWRRVANGELKAARVGRSVRIHLPTLREFMERACMGVQGSETGAPTSGS